MSKDPSDNVLSFNAYKKQLEEKAATEEIFIDDVLEEWSDEDIEHFLLSLIDVFQVPGPANDEFSAENQEFIRWIETEEDFSEHPFLDEFEGTE